MLCHFFHFPTEEHMKAIKCILRNMKGTVTHGDVMQKFEVLVLFGFTDLD